MRWIYDHTPFNSFYFIQLKCLYEYLYKYLNGKSKSASLYETGFCQVSFVIKLSYPCENILSRNQVISPTYILDILNCNNCFKRNTVAYSESNIITPIDSSVVLFFSKPLSFKRKKGQQPNFLSQMHRSLPFQIYFS